MNFEPGWAEKFLNDLASQTGASVESSDISRLYEYQRGIEAGTTTQAQLAAHMEGLRQHYIRRGAPTQHRAQDSQSGLYQDIGGDPQSEPGYVETRDTSKPLFKTQITASSPYVPSPPLVSTVTTLGASAGSRVTPTVGPVGLAYPDDPVNYATGEVALANGYTQGGALESGIYPSQFGGGPVSLGGGMVPGAPGAGGAVAAGGADNTMIYLLLAGAAVAAYFLFVK